jgi:hypothetical protein
MIQQYNTVINSLNQFSEAHLSLKRFKSSFFEQIDNFSTSGNTFPILYAIPNDVVFDENIDRMSFRVYVVDILQKDRSNEQSILNETLLILRDLTNWFREDTTIDLNILNNPRCTPVNNFGVDFTVGWYADYEIEVTQSTSECSIPFSQNFVFTGTSCDISYVNPYLTCETLELCQGYIDLDNQLITGGTYNTSASTINLITKGGDIINITGITAGGGSQNLAEVLANGNSVSGYTIDSTNGNYYLSLTDTAIVLGNTAATSQIVLNNNGVIPFSFNNESSTTNVYGRQQLFDYGFFQGFSTVVGSTLNSNLFTQQLLTPSSFIVNINNADRLVTDATKTTIERLAIQNIGTGTSINNLGIDSSGNVVIGSSGSSVDIYVTGGTYSAGTTTLIRNDGGIVQITGFNTGTTSPVTTLQTYMFSSNNSDITPFEQAVLLPLYVPNVLASTAHTVTTSPTLLQTFITNSGYPDVIVPSGIFSVHFEVEKAAGGNNYFCFAKIYHRDSGGTTTLLATTDESGDSAANTLRSITVSGLLQSATTFTSTDRLVVEIYAQLRSSSANITLYYDNNTNARIALPVTITDVSSLVPYTGAITNVNLGNNKLTTKLVETPISQQTNDSSTAYTIDMSASNIVLFSAGTSTACSLSYSGAVVGQYTLIVDNTSLRTLTLATSSNWYSNLGIQPNLTGLVFISATYDGTRMLVTELESMQQI